MYLYIRSYLRRWLKKMFVSRVTKFVISVSPSLCPITPPPPTPSLQPRKRPAAVGRMGKFVSLEARFLWHHLLLSPAMMLFQAFPNSGGEILSAPCLPVQNVFATGFFGT